jgi:hypothetical protein
MRVLVASLVLASLTTTAAADGSATPGQPHPTSPLPTTTRRGLTFGIGLSVGSLVADCAECNSTFEAGGVHAHVGMMASPSLAIVGEVWTMVHSDAFLTVYQNLATVAVRAWLTPKLWIQGGLGAATAGYRWRFIVDREDRTESSPGITAAIGYELRLKSNLALDLQLRGGTGFYDKDPVDGYVVKGHGVGFGAAVSWY